MSLANYTDRSLDLSDGDLVAAMFHVVEEVKDIVRVRVELRRLGVPSMFDGASRENVNASLFAVPDLRDLRTVTSFEVMLGWPESPDVVLRYGRDDLLPARAAIVVEPRGFQQLVASRDAAATAAKAARTLANSGSHPSKVSEAKAAEAEHAAAVQRVTEVETQAALNMLACVRACHRAGLVRPFRETAVDLPASATGSASIGEPSLAGEIAGLRATITAQQRYAAETAQRLSEEYRLRSEAIRNEADERSARMQSEFAAREQRVEQEVRAREKALAAQTEELAAREARLELNDEKAERRRLRRELQEATKQRAEKPDLSEDAKKAFARVVGTAQWAAAVSGVVMVGAVVAPFLTFFATAERSADVVWLGWSLRVLAGLTCGASLVYLVRTLARRSQLIADTEVRSRQFALDVDRAQWLVEMALEYDKSAKPLSPELVTAFSRGLFESDQRFTSESGSSLNNLLVNAEGVEVSLSRRGVRKALRAADPSDGQTQRT